MVNMDAPLTFPAAVGLARQLRRELLFTDVKQTLPYESSYCIDESGMLVPGKTESLDCSYVAPVSILAKAILNKNGVTINFFKSSVAQNTAGMSVRKGANSVDILTAAGASFCVTRFARLKELIHQWDDAFLSMDTSARSLMLAIDAAMKSLDPDLIDSPSPLHIENFCFFCAMEILLPWGKAGERRNVLLDYRARNIQDLVIARAFRVPLVVIQFISQSNYLEVSRKMNRWYDEHE